MWAVQVMEGGDQGKPEVDQGERCVWAVQGIKEGGGQGKPEVDRGDTRVWAVQLMGLGQGQVNRRLVEERDVSGLFR